MKIEKPYQIFVRFADETQGHIDMTDLLKKPIFQPLTDYEFFKQGTIDEFGAPCWPNGADLAPDALYVQCGGKKPEFVQL